jgi:hypothetical protein
MVKPDHTFTHLQDKFSPNTTDEAWFSELGREGDWTIISGDYRIGKSAHERAAWHESGLTVFFLNKGWTNIELFQQHSKLAGVISGIIAEAGKAKPGSGFSIALNGKITRVYP